MTQDSSNDGYGESNQIIIPLRGAYSIKWNDVNELKNSGNVENCIGNTLVTFPKPGVYRLFIYGKLETMNFAQYTIDSIPVFGTKDFKFLSVDQWGENIWQSFDSFFYKCNNVRIIAKDAPNLSKVTSFSNTFCSALNFNSPLDHWDMSNVKFMTSMFHDAHKFNQSIGSWNVSSLVRANSMFVDAYEFNQQLDEWDVSNVTRMGGMFSGAHKFNQNIENWDVSNVKDMPYMFHYAYDFNT